MQVIFNYDKNHGTSKPCAIALGTFDGIHLGHRQLISELKQQKKLHGFQAIVYTFLAHPLQVLAPEKAPSRLMLLGEKIREFSGLGVDSLVLNSFDEFFMHQTPRVFMDQLYEKYNVRALVVGYNFRFGYKGMGDISFLEAEAEKRGLDLISVPPVMYKEQVVSSTLIRSMIADGFVKEAADMLTKPYSISGKVVHGYGRGRVLGFPTANLLFSRQKAVPKPGVYLTRCRLGRQWRWGLTNVGWNPTFESDRIQIETYVLDYEGNLYGQPFTVSFLERMRDEIKFDNASDLVNQMRQDLRYAKKLIYNFRFM
jgi:riboflavin kinase/FMN adenylyltransferase